MTMGTIGYAGLAPTTSTTVALVMGDALAIALLEARGFTSDDFARSHPAGSLGRRLLLHISDVMHTGDAVPLKPLGTPMSDALVEMTSKGFGCVAIADGSGQIVGIVHLHDLLRAGVA